MILEFTDDSRLAAELATSNAHKHLQHASSDELPALSK
jgi:hypothetical protein